MKLALHGQAGIHAVFFIWNKVKSELVMFLIFPKTFCTSFVSYLFNFSISLPRFPTFFLFLRNFLKRRSGFIIKKYLNCNETYFCCYYLKVHYKRLRLFDFESNKVDSYFWVPISTRGALSNSVFSLSLLALIFKFLKKPSSLL